MRVKYRLLGSGLVNGLSRSRASPRAIGDAGCWSRLFVKQSKAASRIIVVQIPASRGRAIGKEKRSRELQRAAAPEASLNALWVPHLQRPWPVSRGSSSAKRLIKK